MWSVSLPVFKMASCTIPQSHAYLYDSFLSDDKRKVQRSQLVPLTNSRAYKRMLAVGIIERSDRF
jgi:hypothetical protein